MAKLKSVVIAQLFFTLRGFVRGLLRTSGNKDHSNDNKLNCAFHMRDFVKHRYRVVG